VLPQARANSDLTCTFDLAATKLTVAVTAECDSPRPPNRDGFAWTVLAALTNEVAADVDGDRLTVTLARGTTDTE
jgi:serine/threonine-protein kinase RsbW